MIRYRVKPKHRVKLKEWNAGERGELGKPAAQAKTNALMKELDRLQELLYAERKHQVLIVLQGMDTSGKDGTIRHVFGGVNPQGVRVANFKQPTPDEFAHDFLWRIHKQSPATGELVIFNRSHYEDVLVVRVHGLISRAECQARFEEINAFERMLTNEGATILKFFFTLTKPSKSSVCRNGLMRKTRIGNSILTILKSAHTGTSTCARMKKC